MRKLLNNKKGAEMAIGTLVVIVLAVIVLVVVALGFGTGWGNLWSKMTGFFSPTNVDSSRQACTYACTTQAKYDYCCGVKDVKFVKGEDAKRETCTSLGESCGEFTCNVPVECKDLVCNTTNAKISVETNEAACKAKNPAGKVESKIDFKSDGTLLTGDEVCCIIP